ncbi:MAG: beta-hexosaminidase, partial [Lachnospiraceae bacterium]|nr:beta-hexosaminidase [Lachnospiraceae bacterium]
DAIREDIRKHNYGGAILYAQNYKDAEQSLKLIADIQQTAVDSGSVPLIVGTDQEGGRVSRLGFGTSGVGNMALSATGNAENAKKMAQIYGNELSLLGVNTDFAPVVDVNDNPNNPVIGDRSFSDDPEIVSAYGIAYMEGLKDTGTIATLKHFPGHGNTDTDSHTGFPCIQSSYEELKKSELIPFQKAIDAGADMIMTDHIQYPEIEKQTYTSITTGEEVCLPATMSRTILTDILRKDMGFEGVIVTDALDMASITENFETEDVIKLAINAGVDMLIYPSITDTDIFRKTQEMTETAVRLAEDGEIDAQRIDESVRRILTLKEKYGILDKKDFTVTEQQIEAAENGIGSQTSDEEVMKIAGEAVTVLKNDDDTLPISMAEGEKALILFSESSADSTANAEIAKKYLAEKNLIPEKAEITVSVNTAGNEEDCLKAAEEADHVILVHKMLKASNLDPSTDDGYSSGVFDKIIKACHDKGKKVVLISCRLPYDAARFTDADAVILSYSTSAITEIPPEKGEGSAYIPSLPIAIEAAFGAVEAKGKLPVNIPEIGKDYKFTDKILYERSN